MGSMETRLCLKCLIMRVRSTVDEVRAVGVWQSQLGSNKQMKSSVSFCEKVDRQSEFCYKEEFIGNGNLLLEIASHKMALS